ncbi:class I SAM-dependent methyltransferase [Microvirga sp. ACRRW]|uniref:class I SAM-dependent methyltransferase n=1 Tax=Microvirga sp. ACRRW TaxID=2918205 RepID=UPI001EF67B56|nr:class I SAM-dependent methyltransferase [Microvirga sp. ACRRW]MCG7394391.1 class I SAM-dependent methyltransferase [Microvirga sp. ACRRW]
MYGFSDNGAEEFSGQVLEWIAAVNRIVRDSGAMLEGNLCYHHATQDLSGPPDPTRAHKRRNFIQATRGKSRLLEVGFNAGHSAILALAANPRLHYVGVDICSNAYTEKCAEYLAGVFGSRFEMLKGNSLEVLPNIATHRNDVFDVFHVDGGHGESIARTDISNCIHIARRSKRCHLIMDDTHSLMIQRVYDEFISLGHLRTETFGGKWNNSESQFAEIVV